jgi:hypothetical protein
MLFRKMNVDKQKGHQTRRAHGGKNRRECRSAIFGEVIFIRYAEHTYSRKAY